MAEEIFEIPSELRSKLLEEAKRQQRVTVIDMPQRIEELKKCYRQLARKVQFKPGDIVKWKSSLKNRKKPGYGEPAIVIDVLNEPRSDPETESGSTYFGEPLDIVLGLIDEAGDFLVYYYDHRRFELWNRSLVSRASKAGAATHGS